MRVGRGGDGRTVVLAEQGVTSETSIDLIDARFLDLPSQLEIVVNPRPSGGPSNPSRLDVEDIEPTAAAARRRSVWNARWGVGTAEPEVASPPRKMHSVPSVRSESSCSTAMHSARDIAAAASCRRLRAGDAQG